MGIQGLGKLTSQNELYLLSLCYMSMLVSRKLHWSVMSGCDVMEVYITQSIMLCGVAKLGEGGGLYYSVCFSWMQGRISLY